MLTGFTKIIRLNGTICSRIGHHYFSGWFILLSQFCSRAWSNQLANYWICLWISLNDSVSSLPHALSRLKRFSQSCNRKFKNIMSLERSCARPVPGGMPLPRLIDTILIFSQYLRLQKYRPHLFTFCRTDGRRCVMCTCFVMFRCSVAVMRSFHSSPCQRIYI